MNIELLEIAERARKRWTGRMREGATLKLDSGEDVRVDVDRDDRS